MAGAPTEAEIRTQWVNAVDLIEKHRAYADATVSTLGEIDVLEQSLEGTYTMPAIANAAASFRAGLSDLIDPSFALAFLEPILLEYTKFIDKAAAADYGSGATDISSLLQAIYLYFANKGTPITVASRTITYDTSATTSNGTGGSIVGNGAMTRVTKDERNYDLEACFVETKRFRCIADQNSGTKEHAETFEQIGQLSSLDNLLRQDSSATPSFGSGDGSNVIIVSKHAGGGAGGSLLRNSSFTDFNNATTENKFSGWDQSYTGMSASGVSQDTGVSYRGTPGTSSSDDASLKLTVTGGGSNAIVMTQTLENMKGSSLDPDAPYFLRIMWNGNSGTAAGGTVRVRLGDEEVNASVVSTGTWFELIIPADTNAWFRNFNQASFNIDIEWRGGTSGYLLIDDVIFAPYDFIDGTYWCMRGNAASHTSWLLDDTLSFTDTGGFPSTGKLQYWWWVTFGTHLPSTTGPPVILDP